MWVATSPGYAAKRADRRFPSQFPGLEVDALVVLDDRHMPRQRRQVRATPCRLVVDGLRGQTLAASAKNGQVRQQAVETRVVRIEPDGEPAGEVLRDQGEVSSK